MSRFADDLSDLRRRWDKDCAPLVEKRRGIAQRQDALSAEDDAREGPSPIERVNATLFLAGLPFGLPRQTDLLEMRDTHLSDTLREKAAPILEDVLSAMDRANPWVHAAVEARKPGIEALQQDYRAATLASAPVSSVSHYSEEILERLERKGVEGLTADDRSVLTHFARQGDRYAREAIGELGKMTDPDAAASARTRPGAQGAAAAKGTPTAMLQETQRTAEFFQQLPALLRDPGGVDVTALARNRHEAALSVGEDVYQLRRSKETELRLNREELDRIRGPHRRQMMAADPSLRAFLAELDEAVPLAQDDLGRYANSGGFTLEDKMAPMPPEPQAPRGAKAPKL